MHSPSASNIFSLVIALHLLAFSIDAIALGLPSSSTLLEWVKVQEVVATLLRGVGVVFLLAFNSARVQVRGIAGDEGVLPFSERKSSFEVFAKGRGRFRGKAWYALLATDGKR